MYLTSDNWNWQNGVCTKHWLPQVPCPQCIATSDPDMYYQVTSAESDIGFTMYETVRDFERLEIEARCP